MLWKVFYDENNNNFMYFIAATKVFYNKKVMILKDFIKENKEIKRHIFMSFDKGFLKLRFKSFCKKTVLQLYDWQLLVSF